MQDNLPKGFSEDLEKFTTDEEDKLTIASEVGLDYLGRGDDEELRFMGTDEEFKKYDEACDKLK